MAVRIYSLAKELSLDSKELVDLCNRVGITGKGSALASLDDDEVSRIKAHLDGSKSDNAQSAEQQKPATEQEMKRPSAPARTGKPRVIGRSSTLPAPKTPSTAPTRRGGISEQLTNAAAAANGNAANENAVSGDVPDSTDNGQAVVAESTAVDETTDSVESVPPVEDTSPQDEPAANVESEQNNEEPDAAESDTAPVPSVASDPNAPVRPSQSGRGIGRSGKIRVIGGQGGGQAKSGDAKKRKKGKEPVLNLASIPKAAKMPAAKPKEQAVQKPDVKLTQDILSGNKPDPTAAAKTNDRKTGRNINEGGLSKFKEAAEKALRGRDEEEDGKKKRRGLSSREERSGRRNRKGVIGGDDEGGSRQRFGRPRSGTLKRKGTNTAAPRKEKIVLELPCSVRSFSEAAGVPAARVLFTLMSLGTQANINATLDSELAVMLATEMGVEIDFKEAETLESNLIGQLEEIVDAEDDLDVRPPIVTFLGHVDHGKTSLLDYLIGTRIVTGEAGGITQHIRAYQVEKDGRMISFVDTPGHEAFTEMRARGANVTDIAVLVVAAEDGIMPQTEEAISHAKAAGVPIVVAINKIDLEGADPNRIMTQMTEHELTPSEWGGDVEVVKTSAITGQGMDELLETLLTVAELHDYKANSKRAALGVCLESEQAASRGVMAKVVVQTGTLRVGDNIVCGGSHGRVKALYDTLDITKQLTEAGPSVPVNVSGFDTPPNAGEKFYVLDDIAQAREIAESRLDESRNESLSVSSPKVSFEAFQEMLQSGKLGQTEERVILNLIIRADARGSLEAIEKELSKLEHPEVDIRILQKSAGGITVADVQLANASEAVVVGFNVIPDEAARQLADNKGVEIRRYDIIYNLANDIKAIVEGRLKPEERIVELGRALVRQVFSISRVGSIAGCYVVQGSIERGCRMRVSRDGRTIGDYALDTLKRHKDDVKEVPRGMECGIKLAGFDDIKQDDVLEAYRIDEVARTLDS